MDSTEKEADVKTGDVKPTLEFAAEEEPPRPSTQTGSGNKNGNASTDKSGSKEGNIRKKSNDSSSTNLSGNNSQGSTGSAETKKNKTQKEAVNRLYKPTAASEAKSKHATQGRGQKALPTTSMKPPPLAMRRGVPVRLPPRGGGRGSPPVGRGQTGARGRGRATSRPVENVEIEDGRRERTPDSVAKLPARGSSTPTGDPASDTVLEAWDASEIATVNKTMMTGNLLDETTVATPRQALPFTKPAVRGGGLNRTMAGGGGGARQPRTTMKRPQTAVKTARKPTAANSRESNAVLQNTVLEDPEDITDEMLEIAWCRYIQSEYIKRMSKKALEQAEKECERKLLSAWKLLEQTRQEVLKLEEDLILVNIVSDIQDMLKQVGDLLGGEKGTEEGLLGNIQETGELLTQLSNGLEAVKHNIEVKGVEIEPKERQETARRLLQLFRDFTGGTPDLAQLVDHETLQRMQEVERYKELGGGIQRRCKENSDMLNVCRTLAVKEASLGLSLKDLAVTCGQPTTTDNGEPAAEGQETVAPPSLDLPPPMLEQPLIDALTVNQSSSAAAL